MVLELNLLFVALITLSATILLIRLCVSFHTMLMPKKTPLEKYTFFKIIRDRHLAESNGKTKLYHLYFYLELVVYLFLSVLLPMSLQWICIFELSAFWQVPYLLSYLSLKQIDDKSTLDNLALKLHYRIDLVGNIVCVLLIVAFKAISRQRQRFSLVSKILSCSIFSATMAVAIWLINGSGKRLFWRVKSRLKKLVVAKPKLRLRPTGAAS